ncbi:MAG: hypothetical protein E7165_03880 [Firmicutes bacterium]|nr:hypothetical protein [Bacillota bacterium]
MAIHCDNPNTISSEAEELFGIVSDGCGGFIEDLETVIHSLDSHWKGTDAVKNLAELASLYTEITKIMQNLETTIVNLNNEAFLPLQKHIVDIKGMCTIGNELEGKVKLRDSYIAVQTEGTQSITMAEIVKDIAKFEDFPERFSSLVEDLNTTKEKLLKNWQEGPKRGELVEAFNKFENQIEAFAERLTAVRDNLIDISIYKQQLL